MLDFLNTSNNETEILLRHLEKLRKQAVTEQPTAELKKWYAYYSGEKEEGAQSAKNKYNVIKGIIDSQVTLMLDNEIVSTVIPRLKTFVDKDGLALQNDIADILKDINAYVLDTNTFDKIKSQVALNEAIYSVGFTETIWEQNEEDKLGDIRINALNPLKCFPDGSAKTIEDCNYFFIEEDYSPITLKKKYPDYARKLQGTFDDTANKNKDKDPTGVTTVGSDTNTMQVFSYGNGDNKDGVQQKNIKVWKCYLKDDSTFIDKETDQSAEQGEAELKFKYPNGRLILYVDGAKDYVLEDKPIDYPFGFPIDIYSSNTNSIWGQSQVSYLINLQDRINRAWERVQYLVASYVSFIIVDGHLGVDPADLVTESIVTVDNISENGIGQFANNTLTEIEEMLKYIEKLKENAYEIARVNPMMISGERPQGVTSGEQIVQLNQSPMLAIKEKQRHFKYFICEQGKKNIVLIQLFYNTPRMIRLTNSKQVAELPTMIDQNDPANEGLQQQPIQIHEQKTKTDEETGEVKTYYEAIKTIQGDLSIGEYDMQVIAGTEMPRSRTERAQITMELAKMGYLGDNRIDVAETVLTALDYPHRYQVIDKMQEEQEALAKNPPAEPPTDKIAVAFKDLSGVAQGEWYQQHGFPQAAGIALNQQTQNISHLKDLKELTT